ncbi:MAG: GntR family transcriptional regulator [Aromatoleum sp.]|jgi:DNA-binding GntR family transcriptional regulator|uniref:GntR family transcriptional regulator n=1 Tax=Aromatoleum sp. TaxID=2307007 RepID=UPI002894DDCE|nr:GntR family transcriptional regulator [Aromatoleum sp.]MDT3669390.1 GntR family transcriptional regulator [Aromatoleum sp.]
MVPSLKPVERPLALGEQVYHTLRSHLRNGQIVAGQPLQEVQLAEQLGVSRTPVREALRRLASEGLLVSDGRSFIVPALTLDDVNDIYEIRFLIEPAAIKSIAGLTHSRELRRSIEDALAAAARAHKAEDAVGFRDATIRFRDAWLALVPNPRLVRIVEQYADHMQRIRTLTLDDSETRTIVLRGLNRITTALAAGDGDTAAAAMLEHLGEAKRAFIAAVGLAEEDPLQQ